MGGASLRHGSTQSFQVLEGGAVPLCVCLRRPVVQVYHRQAPPPMGSRTLPMQSCTVCIPCHVEADLLVPLQRFHHTPPTRAHKFPKGFLVGKASP